MYNFLYNLGNAVINFFHPNAFVASLPLLLEGMIGIFIVMAVIFFVIWYFGRFQSKVNYLTRFFPIT